MKNLIKILLPIVNDQYPYIWKTGNNLYFINGEIGIRWVAEESDLDLIPLAYPLDVPNKDSLSNLALRIDCMLDEPSEECSLTEIFEGKKGMAFKIGEKSVRKKMVDFLKKLTTGVYTCRQTANLLLVTASEIKAVILLQD
jgi:hypothetical protein